MDTDLIYQAKCQLERAMFLADDNKLQRADLNIRLSHTSALIAIAQELASLNSFLQKEEY